MGQVEEGDNPRLDFLCSASGRTGSGCPSGFGSSGGDERTYFPGSTWKSQDIAACQGHPVLYSGPKRGTCLGFRQLFPTLNIPGVCLLLLSPADQVEHFIVFVEGRTVAPILKVVARTSSNADDHFSSVGLRLSGVTVL